MSDCTKALPGDSDLKSAKPMYLRPVAILVRPGNPKRTKGFRDVLAPGVKVLAVADAGRTSFGRTWLAALATSARCARSVRT